MSSAIEWKQRMTGARLVHAFRAGEPVCSIDQTYPPGRVTAYQGRRVGGFTEVERTSAGYVVGRVCAVCEKRVGRPPRCDRRGDAA